jgi:hypothetical protein
LTRMVRGGVWNVRLSDVGERRGQQRTLGQTLSVQT